MSSLEKKPSQPVEGSYDRFDDLFNNLPTLVGEYCIRHGEPLPGATEMSRRSSEERGKLLDIAVAEGILPAMGDGIRRCTSCRLYLIRLAARQYRPTDASHFVCQRHGGFIDVQPTPEIGSIGFVYVLEAWITTRWSQTSDDFRRLPFCPRCCIGQEPNPNRRKHVPAKRLAITNRQGDYRTETRDRH